MRVMFDLDLGLMDRSLIFQKTMEDIEVPALQAGMMVDILQIEHSPIAYASVINFRWRLPVENGGDGALIRESILWIELECCPPDDVDQAQMLLKMDGWMEKELEAG